MCWLAKADYTWLQWNLVWMIKRNSYQHTVHATIQIMLLFACQYTQTSIAVCKLHWIAMNRNTNEMPWKCRCSHYTVSVALFTVCSYLLLDICWNGWLYVSSWSKLLNFENYNDTSYTWLPISVPVFLDLLAEFMIEAALWAYWSSSVTVLVWYSPQTTKASVLFFPLETRRY